MNEELQSTNEELYTLNEEMRQRTDELNNSNAFLNSILSSMRAAIIVLDNDLIVHIWNLKAQDLWGLRPEEAQGKAFMNLDIGLRVEELKRPIRACLLGETEHEDRVVEAVNRRGRKVRCRVSCYRFTFEPKKEFGVILLMEEVD
jgi:two-component system CheB/CheR fusion protein